MVYYVNVASSYAIGIIFPVICTIAVGLRFLTRHKNKAGYGADDWASIVALVGLRPRRDILVAISFPVLTRSTRSSPSHAGSCSSSLGPAGDAYHLITRHAPFQTADLFDGLDAAQQTLLLKLEYAFINLSVVAIGAIRMAFVLLYRRIFRGRVFAIANWTLIAIIVGWTIAFFFALIFQCGSHFSAEWTSAETYGHYCTDSFGIMAVMGVSDVIIDMAILILPIGPVRQLQMDTKRKLGLLAIFSLGIFSVAAGITRMIFLMQIVTYQHHNSSNLFGLDRTSNPIGLFPAGGRSRQKCEEPEKQDIGVKCTDARAYDLHGNGSRSSESNYEALNAGANPVTYVADNFLCLFTAMGFPDEIEQR
nr:hypothetical protein CFP56_64106 [Quercus suber]